MSELGSLKLEQTIKKEKAPTSYFLRYPSSDIISVEVPSTKGEETPAEMAARIREERKRGKKASISQNDRVSLSVTSPLVSMDTVLKLPVTLDSPQYFKLSSPLAQKDKESYPNSVWLEKTNLTSEELEKLKKQGKLMGLNSIPLTKDVKTKIATLLDKDIAKV